MPGTSSGGGTWVSDDDDGVAGDEPRLGSYRRGKWCDDADIGGYLYPEHQLQPIQALPVHLVAVLSWTITPPSGGEICRPVTAVLNGTRRLLPLASSIATGSTFNPLVLPVRV